MVEATKIQRWVARLNWLADHPAERDELRAGCVLLGHVASGEQIMTAQPIDVCWYCGDEFYEGGPGRGNVTVNGAVR